MEKEFVKKFDEMLEKEFVKQFEQRLKNNLSKLEKLNIKFDLDFEDIWELSVFSDLQIGNEDEYRKHPLYQKQHKLNPIAVALYDYITDCQLFNENYGAEYATAIRLFRDNFPNEFYNVLN